MDKNEFISKLDSFLKGINDIDRKEIIYDYEEHFAIGAEQGKTEEQISEALGDPKAIAKQFKNNLYIKRAEMNTSARNVAGAVFVSTGAGFMNLLILPVLLAAACVLLSLLIAGGAVIISLIAAMGAAIISFYGAAAGMTLGGIGTIIALIVQPYFPEYINFDINMGSTVFLSLGVICLGLLAFIGTIKLSKACYRWSKVCVRASYVGAQKCVQSFYLWVLKYLKMNVALITGKKENENDK